MDEEEVVGGGSGTVMLVWKLSPEGRRGAPVRRVTIAVAGHASCAAPELRQGCDGRWGVGQPRKNGRQTDRQRDRQAGRQRDRQTDKTDR